ncbi:hypothetical protein [Micromonospora sp. NPDC093277]|uniref:hypothetical protein n=1 Tax=Micromonospora sp. NPDC093277 TaxID=3364291 RepID=UPI00382BEEA6
MSSASAQPTSADLERAEIIVAGYPIAGSSAWLPHGFELCDRVLDRFSAAFEDAGFEELAMPSLVAETTFDQQAEAIKDFRRRLYMGEHPDGTGWHVIAPTIEAQISTVFARWLADGDPLPLRIICVRTVGRHETGGLRPLWKDRLVWPFFEAQVALHGDVGPEIDRLVRMPRAVCAGLGLPTLAIERLSAAALSSSYADRRLELVTVLPGGELTMLTSVYDLGSRFSDAFAVGAGDEPLTMLNFAFSGRLLLALVQHSWAADGPVYQPALSPVQVAVLPSRSTSAERLAAVHEAAGAAGIRAATMTGRNLAARRQRAADLGCPVVLHLDESTGKDLWTERFTQASHHVDQHPAAFSAMRADLDRLDERMRAERADRPTGWTVRCTDLTEVAATVGSGVLAAVPLCGHGSCPISVADDAGVDLIGRLYPETAGGSGGVCLACGAANPDTILFGRKIKGEK